MKAHLLKNLLRTQLVYFYFCCVTLFSHRARTLHKQEVAVGCSVYPQLLRASCDPLSASGRPTRAFISPSQHSREIVSRVSTYRSASGGSERASLGPHHTARGRSQPKYPLLSTHNSTRRCPQTLTPHSPPRCLSSPSSPLLCHCHPPSGPQAAPSVRHSAQFVVQMVSRMV